LILSIGVFCARPSVRMIMRHVVRSYDNGDDYETVLQNGQHV
jgi:hypothetical protein